MNMLTPARIIREAGAPELTKDHLPPYLGEMSDLFVGVIDTGVVLRGGRPHPFLDGRVRFDPHRDVDEPGDDAIACTPADSDGHGTFVAGVILAQAPSVNLQIKGVLDRSRGQAEDTAVATAIDELAQQGITLMNLSFSGDSWEEQAPQVITDALLRLPPGVVVVAAGGNRPTAEPAYPAAIQLGANQAMVIAVGAADTSRQPSTGGPPPVADFSCFGDWVTAYANGRGVLGPNRDGWSRWSGTSFAAATVTGRIAAAMLTGSDARTAAQALLAGAPLIIAPSTRGPKPYVGEIQSVRG